MSSVKTVVSGYKTYTMAKHTSPTRGTKNVYVKCSNGESCDIALDINNNKILEVAGDLDPYLHYLQTVHLKELSGEQ